MTVAFYEKRKVQLEQVVESLSTKASLSGSPWQGGYLIIGSPVTEEEYNSNVQFDFESDKPSWGTVVMEWDALKEQTNNEEYKYQRAASYPRIEEQLDMIFHDIDAWKAKIQEVKDAFPKPVV